MLNLTNKNAHAMQCSQYKKASTLGRIGINGHRLSLKTLPKQRVSSSEQQKWVIHDPTARAHELQRKERVIRPPKAQCCPGVAIKT